MASKIVGGCMCGAVRYESTADAVMQANCYCRDCQRSTGGAFAPVVLVPKAAFTLTKGDLTGFCGRADFPAQSGLILAHLAAAEAYLRIWNRLL